MAGEVKDLFVGVVAAATVSFYALFNMDHAADTPPAPRPAAQPVSLTTPAESVRPLDLVDAIPTPDFAAAEALEPSASVEDHEQASTEVASDSPTAYAPQDLSARTPERAWQLDLDATYTTSAPLSMHPAPGTSDPLLADRGARSIPAGGSLTVVQRLANAEHEWYRVRGFDEGGQLLATGWVEGAALEKQPPDAPD